jgi:gliding motility-associated-like protein
LVRIFETPDIQVPKAFSPNADGHNDKLEFFLINIDKLYFFRVYNRWGQLVFETNDKQSFWNGRFKGNLQPSETYVWIAEGTDKQGAVINRRGQTILLR